MKDLESEREGGLEALTRAYTSDAISVAEFERRAALIQQARDNASIEGILADLPREVPRDRPLTRAGDRGQVRDELRSSSPRIDDRLSGNQSISCVMSDRSLAGDWLTGNRVQAFTFMGRTKIDLRNVPLPPGGLRIETMVCMGEVVITVPRGLAVRLNASPFMGEVGANHDVTQRAAVGEPVVQIDGFILMGSLKVIASD